MTTRTLPPRSLLLGLALSAVGSILPARIVSYAPVTDRHAMPAVQHRTNRFYVLVEADFPISSYGGAYQAKLVLYDSKGEREPRVLLGGPEAQIYAAAAREESDGSVRILVRTNARLGADNPQRANRFLYTPDSGATWRVVPIDGELTSAALLADVGGPVARERGSAIRIGSRDLPFVLVASDYTTQMARAFAVRADGGVKVLADLAWTYNPPPGLAGSNREGTRFLLSGSPASSTGPLANSIRVLDLDGRLEDLQPLPQARYGLEGWITPNGSVYLEDSGRVLLLYRAGTVVEVARALTSDVGPPSGPGIPPPISQSLFAVPTADFTGSWIVQRGTGSPTILSRHEPGSALAEQWRDISAPEVEALHAGASGSRLLIQVHVPRAQADQRIFRDPALAVWEVGRTAPGRYDELFLVEGPFKGFVHLDVDAVAAGDPFVFDSAATFFGGGGVSPSPGGGGGDVTQEWGVVRASLKQRLVVPAVGRLAGGFGSFWRTDLIVRNPSAERVSVLARFVPGSTAGSAVSQPVERRLELGPSEIWLYPDVLGSIFGLANGSGALILVPDGDAAITATSRTYTDSPQGTYGAGIGAVDFFAAAGARFPLSFSGALQGTDFRTNLVAVDTSGRGSDVAVRAPETGDGVRPDFPFRAPSGGQAQVNGLAQLLGVPPDRSGALVVQPLSGEVVASVVAVDNRTNDPTWFPPDLPSPYVRTIPVIGHVDGANGSKFRSDLFLFNSSDQPQPITLTAKRWDLPETEAIVNLTLSPRESLTVRDVLPSLFGRTGIARLRYVSNSYESSGVRVTSRLYTLDPSGGTFGLLMPPLNSFQSAGPGESLEILGPQGGRNFRTNLSLVELTAFADGSSIPVRIEILDDFGALLDRFETSVPVAGGVQLLDIFRARGLGNGPTAALIRVSPLGGLVGTFATTLDNGTNDPTYHPAALASR
jgi:hypothetical protein